MSDRPGFHSEEYIYPVGFCSTRIYASTKNAEQKCLYTCKITDGGVGPKVRCKGEIHKLLGELVDKCDLI